MARAVRFDHYGDRDVLYIAEVDVPQPAAGQVVVQVQAAGINPGEASIRKGLLAERFPATFPSGEGSDLAGIVSAVGEGVTNFVEGDEVLGWSWDRSSHADFVAVPADQLITRPPDLDWSVAGSLYVVGVTAFAAVRAISPESGETVVVSAAAGGVGSLVVQLLTLRGVKVIAIASVDNHGRLRSLGTTPVAYGVGLAERISTAAPGGVDGFIDLFGPEYVELAVELGVRPDRIETIISYQAAQKHGTKMDGSADASTTDVLTEMADLIATGKITLDIAATYPLDQVHDAFAELEKRHTHGKIVLVP
jgi:NADPH2:quinone reductase